MPTGKETQDAEADRLNNVSQPLGYAVTCQPGGGQGDDETGHRRFTVHRVDHPVAHGPSYAGRPTVGPAGEKRQNR
ncbi:hypothetical protein [Mycobacterium celatum]|uniref:Uncharacterized protein n=1 Tax=Mycobacterium celatum TaxID=28045 RepID=A0A1X1RUN0_MYCCE|nr:hypothetical protein [Mycobacterium celatum]ORV18055.1 hypothetical protein AWB95_04355 [Mycobacterium celatum]PIB80459.1 hypothetical protein CQY23_02600 [Mycobacterium celatum]